MVSTHENEQLRERFHSSLDEWLNDFISGSNFQTVEAKKNTIQTHNDNIKKFVCSKLGENRQSQTQIADRYFADRVRRQEVGVVAAVENQFLYAILTAIDSVPTPGVETAVNWTEEYQDTHQRIWSKILTVEIFIGKRKTICN